MCTRRDALRSAAATSGALCAMTSGRSRKLWWPAGRSPTLLHSRPLREWGGGGGALLVVANETGCIERVDVRVLACTFIFEATK